MLGSVAVSLGDDHPLPRRQRKRVAQGLGVSLHVVDEHWAAGRLRVDRPGWAATRILALEALVFDDDVVLFDGAPLGPAAATVCAVLNKPKGVTCTARDPKGRGDLSPYLRRMPPGCFAVGRLDRDTTGLLLFTNDGDLANAVLRPDHRIDKLYSLWVDEAVSGDDPRLTQLALGVVHDGEVLAARSATVLATSDTGTELELTLTQGRNRQVRRMCAVLGLPLVHLHRRRVGPLTDDALPLGGHRMLDPAEVDVLWEALGGRAELKQRRVDSLVRQAKEARDAGTPDLRLERWLACEASARLAR
jgi:23S rRNA pseudouridine2605 synthase